MKLSELELSILHTFSNDLDLFSPCENLAFPDIWQTKINQSVFKIIKSNHENKVKTDLHLLKNGLLKLGYSKENVRAFLQTFNTTSNSIKTNIKAHMTFVFDAYRKRELQPFIKSAWNEIYSNNGDIDENINKLKDIFNELDAIKNNLTAEKSILDIFDETYEEFELAQKNENSIIGYSTGLTDLDDITCGLKREVIVVGAAPGAGKSTLMVNTAINVSVKSNSPMIIFSIEMPAAQLMRNMWANYFQINSRAIRGGDVDEEGVLKIKSFREKLKTNLIIDDTSGITSQYIETKVRIARRSIPLDQVIVIAIDYLQRMNNTKEDSIGQNEERQLAIRCKHLAEISKIYNVCMIEFSQLSRTCIKEKRRASPSDLLGGGGIEQCADQIWMMFRPDYYESNPVDLDGSSLKGVCEIDIAKNRYGKTKAVYVNFDGKYSRFNDYKKDGDINTKGNDDVF